MMPRKLKFETRKKSCKNNFWCSDHESYLWAIDVSTSHGRVSYKDPRSWEKMDRRYFLYDPTGRVIHCSTGRGYFGVNLFYLLLFVPTFLELV